MAQPSRLGGKRWAFGTAVLLAVAGGAYLGRGPLLAWFYVHQLAAADFADRESWVERVAGLDEEVLPGLLNCLGSDNARVCGNAEAALAALARRWGPDEPRSAALAQQLLAAFPGLGLPGQEAVLEWQIALLHTAGGKGTAPAARDLLLAAAPRTEPGLRLRALALADVLVDRLEPGPCLAACQDLIRKGLTDAQPDTRIRAAHLLLHARFRGEADLLRQVLPLLRDPSAVVRRAALLAVGPVKEMIGDEDLLPLLHDPDADVRRLCETALKGRGVHDSQLTLGRLMTDSRASERLQVVHHIHDEPDVVEPGVWLRRLSQDPSPAVRAAAVRAAAEAQVNLRDRLLEMAQGDPSATVRQLAAHYLRRR